MSAIIIVAMMEATLAAANSGTDGFRPTIEADWARQEQRSKRSPGDPITVRQAMRRAERLLAQLAPGLDESDRTRIAATLRSLGTRIGDVNKLEPADRLALYHDIRWATRDLAMRNPLLKGKPIVFMERRRFIRQMLHEYLGYYYDYGDIAGGGVYVLDKPGESFAIRDLIRGRLPRGNYVTLSLSFDARTIYFAFAPRADRKPDYYSSDRRCFHIHAMDADGGHLRQLTDGPDDDFDPCELPDGGIAFMSTRRGGFGRCHNPWEPLPTYTLHRMDRDGRNIRTLSFHETNEWHPSVLNDGSIVYSRWDYVDRSAANFHGLWVSRPDGTNPRVLFGNYTERINACYQPRAIPGSGRIAFVAGAHHADVGGSLVIVDPTQTRLDPNSGEDCFESLDVLTPEVCFPEAPGWPTSYLHSPWPLSEDCFLVAFSFDPLPGMGPRVRKDTETGLYYFDRFGNMELLYRREGISSMYPIPLAPRPTPPVIPSSLDASLGDQGEFILTGVGQSHFPLPKGRPVKELRVFQVLPKTETHIANQPRLGYANAESARMLLGTVPVRPDGSAYFRAPARKPLYFQIVDEKGHAVQGMRSVTYLQPGERRGCVGCHEPTGTTTESVRRTVTKGVRPFGIQAGPDGSRPWSYARLIQPILDVRCAGCHDGGKKQGKHDPDLSGRPEGEFTRSYQGLREYVRWYEWGSQSLGQIVTHPGHMPADESPLTRILGDTNHAGKLNLTDDERRRIALWLDGNAAFYGTYSKAEQLAQKDGQAIPPPQVQ